MGCLSGLVYLKGCSINEVPGAIYNLNSLLGISLKSFAEVADSEQVNYLGVWEDINERAEARIKNEIMTYLSTRYNLKRVRRTVDTANVQPTAPFAAGDTYQGIVLNQAYMFTDDWILTPFANFSVDKIRFYYGVGTVATSVDIQFFNYLTKEILDTKTIDLTAYTPGSWIEVSILKKWNIPVLGVGFNSTDIETLTYSAAELNGLWAECMDYCYDVSCGYLQGFVSSTNNANGNLNNGDLITGLQIVVTMGCDYDPAICSNRQIFAEAFWYLLGCEFMSERLYTSRVNYLSTIKREEARELFNLYEGKYREALKNALDGLKFSCDACLECNSLVTVFSPLP